MNKSRILKKFIKGIDKDIKVVNIKGAMCCAPASMIVYAGLGNTEEENELFMNYVNSLEKEEICQNALLMGILHEIGHCETYLESLDALRDEEYALLQVAFENDLMTFEELNQQYFEMPLEKNATLWAIAFAKKHKNYLKYFEKLLTK